MAAVVLAGSLVSVLASARTSSPSAPAAKAADPAPNAQAAQSRRRRAPRRTYDARRLQPDREPQRQPGLERQPGQRHGLGDPHEHEHGHPHDPVGDEPQSVALDPNNRYAFVANAAAGTVTVIRITQREREAASERPARRRALHAPGAEPWNIVASPDGRRVFVANSGQDTITVIDVERGRAASARIIGHVNLRDSRCNDPDRDRHFQPRGLAVTQNSNRSSTSRASSPSPGPAAGRRRQRQGGRGLPAEHQTRARSEIRGYRPARRITLALQVTGFTDRRDRRRRADPTSRLPEPAAEHRDPRQPGLPAEHRRLAGRAAAVQRRHAGVRQRHRRRRAARTQTDASAAKFLNLHLGARNPEPGKKKLFFANPGRSASRTQSGAGNAYVVSAGSDLLVKLNVDADGQLELHRRRRHDALHRPERPGQPGDRAATTPARTRRASSINTARHARLRA